MLACVNVIPYPPVCGVPIKNLHLGSFWNLRILSCLSSWEIIQKIIKEYGEDSYVHYYGLTSQEERQDNIRKFQNDPKCRFLIGTPQTGGYGITLTQANTVIYYSNSYDLEKRLQSEDRAHRIGQQKNVTYIDLIAEDTVDEKIVKALRNKINIASEVMGEELKDWI